MKYLPVGLDIRGRECLVVGGGAIGLRKVQNLRRAGGQVTLVSLESTEELAHMAASGDILWRQEGYRESHLHGVFLAVAATDDEGVNSRVVDGAKRQGILVCDASSSDRSQLIFGALHQGDGVTVAVFTDGESPSLARTTRDRIATFVSPDSKPKPSASE
jgi:siroheme synthase-like protein